MAFEPSDDLRPQRCIARRWNGARWLLLGLIPPLLWFGVVFAYGAFSAWRDHQRAVADVEAEASSIRAAGEPITPDELDQWRRLPLGIADATDVWLTAFSSFNKEQFDEDGKPLPYIGEGKFASLRPTAEASQLGKAEAFLEKYEPMLRAAFTAASQPGECRFPVELDMGEDAFLPYEGEIRCVERALRLSAHVRAVQGDSEAATESLLALLALSSVLDHQVSLAELAVQQRVFSQVLLEAGFLLRETQFNEDQLTRLQSKLQTQDTRGSLTQALIGQRAITFSWLHAQPGLKGATSLAFLDLMSQLIDASREPISDAIMSAHRVRDEYVGAPCPRRIGLADKNLAPLEEKAVGHGRISSQELLQGVRFLWSFGGPSCLGRCNHCRRALSP